MRIKSMVLGFGAVAAAVAMVMAPASAEASVVWSWSFGSSSNGAAGTFTTTDVPDLNNPAGTYSVLQFTLDFLNGNPVSAIDTALSNSPSFVYHSASDYGFINGLGFFDSGLQSFNGGGGNMLLSGSAAYEASLQPSFQRANLVNLNGASAFQGAADLHVSLLNPPGSVPEPQTLVLALLALGAAAVARRQPSPR